MRGLTARDAVHAALLAEKGFLSDGEALDGKYGFFNLFAGAPPRRCRSGSESVLSLITSKHFYVERIHICRVT